MWVVIAVVAAVAADNDAILSGWDDHRITEGTML